MKNNKFNASIERTNVKALIDALSKFEPWYNVALKTGENTFELLKMNLEFKEIPLTIESAEHSDDCVMPVVIIE